MQFKRIHALFLFGIVLVIIMLAGFTYWFSQHQQFANSPATTLLQNTGTSSYTDLSDNPVSLTSDRQVRLVTSWASWCPQCKQQLIDLSALAGEFQNEQVSVIAINRQESKEVASRFLATLPELPHLQIVLDPNDRFFNTIDGYAMPETVLFNKIGDLVVHRRGVVSLNELRQLLADTLAESAQ